MRIEVKNNPDALLAAAGYERYIRGWIKPLWKNPLSEDAKRYIANHFDTAPNGTLVPRKKIKSHRFHALITGNVIDLHFNLESKSVHITKRFWGIVPAEVAFLALLDETYEREAKSQH